MDDTPRLPRGLQRLLDQLTVEDKYRKFRIGNSRAPEDDDEVEEFVQELARCTPPAQRSGRRTMRSACDRTASGGGRADHLKEFFNNFRLP